MNILIVKLSPIEGINSSTMRTLALTNGLTSLGHNVDFLTIPMSSTHVKMKSDKPVDNIRIIRTKENSIYDNIVSTKNKSNALRRKSIKFLRNVYHKFTLYNYTYSIAKNIEISILKRKEYDIVISSSDPKTSHIALKKLIKQGLKYKKWIQYWGDPMAIDITNKSIYPKWLIKKVEKKLLDNADKIVYVSPFTLEQQIKIFPDLKLKMCFLPVPYNKEKYYEKTSNKKFTISYFGSYPSTIRNIYPLYNTAVKMQSIVYLNIVGDSDILLENKPNVDILPRGDINDLEKDTDLLVCMLNKSGTQIPGKLYHYAATNKPILVLLDGDNKDEMKAYLESYNRYIICDNTEDSILLAITNYIDNPKEFHPCKEFSPSLIADLFIS